MSDNSKTDFDPSDWEAFRKLGHRAVDDAVTRLSKIREGKVWQGTTEETAAAFSGPMPEEGMPLDQVYSDAVSALFPASMGNQNPRFWGWYMGAGTAGGALADFVAAVEGSNLGGGDTGAAKVEWQVIDWLTEMVGFPKGAGGILTSSGSQANLNCLATARNKMASVDVRKAGIGALPKPMRFYASKETHSCVAKALEVMGHGTDALRLVPVNARLAMDPNALPGMIAEDRAAGFEPVCVIGTAGATNTGAIDDLVALSQIARDEGLWFHVDGCVGAVVKLSHQLSDLVDGLEAADSVALDLHKWLQVPFGVGAAVVRRKTDQSDTFAAHGDYLEMKPRGLIVGDFFGDYGIDLSRGLSALKVWMTFKEQGRDKIGRMIDHTIELARGAAERAEAEPQLQCMAPCPINVACFRFWDASLSDAALDAINTEIMLQLQEDGTAVMSDTLIDGKTAIRMAISNHRTVKADVDEVLDAFVARGRVLLAEGFADGVAAQ